MRKSRRMRKAAAMLVAGGTMLQFGGCGNFWNVTWRSIPQGVGQTLGAGLTLAVPVAIGVGSLQPIIDQFLNPTTTP